MNKIEIQQQHDVPEQPEKIISSLFGSVTQVTENKYKVNDPEYDLLNEVTVIINEHQNEVKLDFTEISVQTYLENEDKFDFKDVIQSKNELINELTGTTVDTRRKKLKQQVL